MPTLRDLVRERQPEVIKRTSVEAGGVVGCPRHYKYLHKYLQEDELKNNQCPVLMSKSKCFRCWNREAGEKRTEHSYATLKSSTKDELALHIMQLERDANVLNKRVIELECELSKRGENESKNTNNQIEIVHCKDCRSWIKDFGERYCGNPNGLADAKPGDFCSYGKHKE